MLPGGSAATAPLPSRDVISAHAGAQNHFSWIPLVTHEHPHPTPSPPPHALPRRASLLSLPSFRLARFSPPSARLRTPRDSSLHPAGLPRNCSLLPPFRGNYAGATHPRILKIKRVRHLGIIFLVTTPLRQPLTLSSINRRRH